ncbi:MAG: PqqD family protein [Planctomycetota bacterium]
MTLVIQKADTQADRELAPGAVVIVDCPSGTYRVLNESGSYLWTLLDGQRGIPELAAALSERYGLPPEVALTDASAFVASLKERGMVKVGS